MSMEEEEEEEEEVAVLSSTFAKTVKLPPSMNFGYQAKLS
jgi:hypothetical protein